MMCALEGEADDDGSEGSIRRLIQLSRADKNGLVSVAGPRGIQALGLLCRENFQRVQCAREAACAGAEDASDVLILAGRLRMEDLEAQLRRTVSLLRDGGVIAVELNEIDDDYRLQKCLRALGLAVDSAIFNLSHEVLVAHRVSRIASLRQAA